jgi:hypothetical protein
VKDCKGCFSSTADAAVEISCLAAPGGAGLASVDAAGCAGASAPAGANRTVCAVTSRVVKLTAAKAAKGAGLASLTF